MRKIEYILIDSDTESHDSKYGRRHVPDSRYHFCVNREGLVINGADIRQSVNIIEGPIYDPDKFNKCAIVVRYCGSIRPDAWILEPETSYKSMMQQRKVLIELLVELRKHFPDAKILGVAEIDGKASHCKNIIVSDAINVLRQELSDLP